MAHWEFLIQQEGDRSWLPLDAPDVEILEGRYRIVARSSQTNASVDIRIVHEALYENPPRRRTQNRSTQTNPDGLMMVIPFTQLQPGTWELRCTCDVMSELLGEGWQATVLLHVLPHEAQATDDWDLDWTPGVDEPTESAIANPISDSHPKTLVEQHEPQAIANAAMDQVAAESEPAVGASAEPSDAFMDDTADSTTAESVTDTAIPDIDPPSDVTASQAAEPNASEPVISDEPAVPDALTSDVIASPPPSTDMPHDPEPRSHTSADLGEYVQAVDDLIDSVFQQLDESLADSPEPPITSPPASFESSSAASVIESSVASPDPVDASSEAAIEQGAIAPDLPYPEAIAADSDASSELDAIDPAPSVDDSATLDAQPDAAVPSTEATDAPASPQLSALPLTLHLETDTYTVPRTGALTLSGTMALTEAIAPDSSSDWATHYQLRIRLVDPQTGRSRQDVVELLPDIEPSQLPLPFHCELSPNLDPNTHLLLGDLELFCTDTPDRAIAVQSFTVTVDVTDLLSAIAQEPDASSELFQAPLAQDAKPAPAPDLTFLSFLSSPPQSMGMKVSAAASDRATPSPATPSPAAQSHADGIDLPTFGTHPTVASQSPDPDASQGFMDPNAGAVSPVEPNAEPDSVGEAATADAAVPCSTDMADVDAWANTGDEQAIAASSSITSPPIDPLDSSTIQPPPPMLEEDEDFQSLKLGDRFLTRLSSLANDRELTHWLSAVAPPPQSAQDATDDDLYGVTSPWQTAPSGWDADIASDEIVVDDNRGRSSHYTSSAGRSMAPVPAAEPPSTMCIPEDQPIPTPTLDIPAPELTAGQPTHLRVLLPNVESKIYVKVWIHDCQQRMVVDGPHWVSNFLPNSQNQLEGSLLLTVPLGCMEARIEAIAIEILTQRESRKVSINRFVMPPNLPDMAFDELDV